MWLFPWFRCFFADFEVLTKLAAEHKFTLYGSLYMVAAGVYGITPILSAWLANNSEPHYRRATSVALVVLAANAVCFFFCEFFFFAYSISILFQGGILSTWSYPTKDGPKFHKTTIMNLLLYVNSLFFPPPSSFESVDTFYQLPVFFFSPRVAPSL